MEDGDAPARLTAVRTRIAAGARAAQRRPDDVALIAVSKTQPVERIRPLIEAGQRRFGENRVQEAAAKWPPAKERTDGVELHMVGRLQSNKARDALRLFDVIHSLDRIALVDALARAQDQEQRRVPCFVQVDIGDEPQKGGVALAGLPGLLASARDAGVEAIGLMAVPPAEREPAPYFALLAELAARHGLTGLSMGMSGDIESAVMLGATHVRVGTALFGGRTA